MIASAPAPSSRGVV